MSSTLYEAAAAANLPGPAPAGIFARLRAMVAAARSRRALSELDDRLLADIGLTRSDVWRETQRKPWDLAFAGRA
jgi:uncharacterized protein YjiS (DUF1127 family)